MICDCLPNDGLTLLLVFLDGALLGLVLGFAAAVFYRREL